MPWQQINILADAAITDAVSDFLTEVGAEAITFLNASEQAILEPLPNSTPLWKRNLMSGLFASDRDMALIRREFTKRFPKLSFTLQILEDQAWERVWLKDYRAQCFAERLWICPVGQKVNMPNTVCVELDPGLAFGTGTHPSTALCLDWLAQQTLQNKSVIDYGCGSGILAIAAAKLGAKPIWAIDHEPQALLATKQNAEQNAIALNVLHIVAPGALPSLQVDIVLANILAEPLIQLAPSFSERVKPRGTLVLAGILHHQAADLIHAYAPWFKVESLKNQEDWIRIVALRS